MKKVLLLCLLVFLALPVSAATLSTAPQSVNVKQGQNFNVVVSVDPQGVKSYTVKLELKFPAGLLEVKSFNFGDNYSWVAISQPGYDSLDNAGGLLIKTAGYPKGFSAPVTFGTVSFTAKKEGSGAITATNNSLVLDAESKNVISGVVQTAVVIEKPSNTITATLSPTAKTTPKPGATPTPSPSLSPAESPIVVAQVTPEQNKQPPYLLAAIGNVLSFGTGKVWLSIVIVILILAIIATAAIYFIKKIRKPRP